MNVPQPLQVYLDSSDFSNFARLDNDSSVVAEVWHRLLAWQDEGKLQLRYSYAHVTEAAPIQQSDLESGVARLISIRRVCGPRCYMDPFTLLRREISTLREGTPLQQGDILIDNAHWYPEPGGSAEAENFFSATNELKRIVAGRGQRDRVSGLYDKAGNLSPEAAKLLDKKLRSALAANPRGAEISPELAEDVTRFSRGEISKQQLSTAGILSDLRRVAASKSIYAVCAGLRESADKIVDVLTRGFAVAASEGALTRATALSRANVVSAPMLNDLAEKFGIKPNTGELVSSWEATPAFKVIETLAVGLTLSVMQSAGRGRIPKRSDLGDLLHAMYLPYVDVFRADRFTASILRQANVPARAVLVDRFVDLPAAIERLIFKS